MREMILQGMKGYGGGCWQGITGMAAEGDGAQGMAGLGMSVIVALRAARLCAYTRPHASIVSKPSITVTQHKFCPQLPPTPTLAAGHKSKAGQSQGYGTMGSAYEGDEDQSRWWTHRGVAYQGAKGARPAANRARLPLGVESAPVGCSSEPLSA